MLTEQEFLSQREQRVKILMNCGIYIGKRGIYSRETLEKMSQARKNRKNDS